MYKGKESCQGCTKSGSEQPRYNKDELCQDCKDLLKIGKSRDYENKFEYTWMFQHHHAFNNLDFGSDGGFSKSIHAMLSAINNNHAEVDAREHQGFKGSMGSNGKYYNIPSRFFEPMKEFILNLDEIVANVKKEKESIPEDVRKEVSKEKNRIYTEGVDKGRSLLFQLNAGEISETDFNKEHKKY